MLRLTHTGLEHDARTTDQLHAAATFDYLLNTFDRRGYWWTWRQFAAMIRIHTHPGNVKARTLADTIDQERNLT